MAKRQTRQGYLSYLLRLWQISDGERQVWRASLQSPDSEEQQGFASLEDLYAFLDAQAGQAGEKGIGDL
jgi:hypothetical protein